MERGLSRGATGRRRHAAAVSPVFDARWSAEPRQPADPWVHPRRRRAGLRVDPRVRRSVRQPRFARGGDRGRRGGGDRSAGRLVEGRQLPQSRPRRRGAPHPAPQRLQDRESHRARAQKRAATAKPLRGPRLRGVHGGRRRAGARARGFRGDAFRLPRSHPRDPPRRAGTRLDGPAALAHDRPAHPQGLDRAARGRGPASGRYVPLPSGTAFKGSRGPGAASATGGLAAQLPAPGTVRRAGPSRREAARGLPHGRKADERDASCERRKAVAAAPASAAGGICPLRARTRSAAS